MLVRNAEVAIAAGHAANRCLVASDGDQLTLDETGLWVSGQVPAEYQFVDGLLDVLSPRLLQERRNLGEAGFVHVTVVVGKNNELVGHPDIATLGWLDKDRSVQVLAELEIEIREAVLSALDSKNDKEAIERVLSLIHI